MIRPFTCVCFLLACGAGLYLYQSKHRVQVLDRQIEDTVRATDQLRERTRVLHAEWTLLNDPQRLQALAEQFLTLKTVTPGQFTSMADLDSRLPPVPPPPAVQPEPEPQPAAPPVPVAQATEPIPVTEPVAAPEAPPAKPVAVAVAAPPPVPSTRPIDARPIEHRPAPRPVRPAPVVAEAAHPRPIPVASRPIEAVSLTRPIAPAPPPPYVGSALGMARGASIALPRPMPIFGGDHGGG